MSSPRKRLYTLNSGGIRLAVGVVIGYMGLVYLCGALFDQVFPDTTLASLKGGVIGAGIVFTAVGVLVWLWGRSARRMNRLARLYDGLIDAEQVDIFDIASRSGKPPQQVTGELQQLIAKRILVDCRIEKEKGYVTRLAK